MCRARRSRSRRNRRFGPEDWALVVSRLQEEWSPEQIAGRLRRSGALRISHETIYRYVWEDRRQGGLLYRHLRGAQKKRRKRYGHYDSRGRLAGKRLISERPPGAENRSRVGHLEGDTMLGSSDKHCVLTLVDRRTGYLLLGKLQARNTEATNHRAIGLIRRTQRRVRTVTVDNGTEFHGYKTIEAATGARFYFATPHHSWERGTCENTNGLLRQYLPKKKSIAHISQADCNRIARRLNSLTDGGSAGSASQPTDPRTIRPTRHRRPQVQKRATSSAVHRPERSETHPNGYRCSSKRMLGCGSARLDPRSESAAKPADVRQDRRGPGGMQRAVEHA
jgi:transposase, IS30 family